VLIVPFSGKTTALAHQKGSDLLDRITVFKINKPSPEWINPKI
jgi:hypothetical protein